MVIIEVINTVDIGGRGELMIIVEVMNIEAFNTVDPLGINNCDRGNGDRGD